MKLVHLKQKNTGWYLTSLAILAKSFLNGKKTLFLAGEKSNPCRMIKDLKKLYGIDATAKPVMRNKKLTGYTLKLEQ